ECSGGRNEQQDPHDQPPCFRISLGRGSRCHDHALLFRNPTSPARPWISATHPLGDPEKPASVSMVAFTFFYFPEAHWKHLRTTNPLTRPQSWPRYLYNNCGTRARRFRIWTRHYDAVHTKAPAAHVG